MGIFSDPKFHASPGFSKKADLDFGSTTKSGPLSRFKFPASKDLIERVMWQESRGKSDAVSPVGAFGLMQLMPDTARDPGFGIKPFDFNAADQDAENMRFGTEYLSAMLDRYNGDEERALVAYNWGPGNADKWDGRRSSLPAETRGYLENIVDKKARPPSGMDNRESPLMAEVPKDPVAVDKDPYSHIAPVEAQMTEEDLQGASKAFGAQGSSIFADPRYHGSPSVQLPNLDAPQPAPPVAPEPATPVVNETAMPEPDNSMSLGGAAKAVGYGLYEGVLGLGGSLGDIREGVKWLGEKTGNPITGKYLGPLMKVAPTGSELLDASENTFGKTYVPKNFLERSLKTGGQLAPAIALGAGGLAKTALGSAAKVATGSLKAGVAVEGAGTIAEAIDPRLRPYAEMGAAIASGNRAARKPISKADIKKHVKKFKDESDELYDSVRDLPVDEDTMKDVLRQALAKAQAAGFDATKKYSKKKNKLKGVKADFSNEQAVANWFKDFLGKVEKGDNTIGTLRKFQSSALAPIFRSGGNNQRIAFALDEAIDDVLKKHPDVADKVARANQAYKARKKAEFIYKLDKQTERKASQMTQGQMRNAVKTKARQVLDKMEGDSRQSKMFKGMWDDKEVKMLQRMTTDKGFDTVFQKLKNLGPSNAIASPVNFIMAAMTALATGSMAPFAIQGGATALGRVAERSLNRAAQKRADKFIRKAIQDRTTKSAGQLGQTVLRPLAIDEGN